MQFLKCITRDGRPFSQLMKIIGKSLQKRFRIKIYAIINPLVRKNRIKKAFYLEKLALEKGSPRTRVFNGKSEKTVQWRF